MGAAVYIPLIDCAIGTNLYNWPSSTRAELVAILLALIIAPKFGEVTLYIDSTAAIYTVEKIKRGISHRQWLKMNNQVVCLQIHTLIKDKAFNKLELIKVKAHSGIVGNEKADLAAKQVTNHLRFSFINKNFNNL